MKLENKMAVSERCKTHPDEIYTFYCGAHDMVYCPVCTEEFHGECIGVSFLRDAPPVGDTDKYEICNNLDGIVTDIENRRAPIEADLAKILDQKAKYVIELGIFREEIMAQVDDLILKARDEIQTAFHKVEDIINEDLEKLPIILTAIDCAKAKSCIATDKSLEQNFVDLKLGRLRLDAVQDMVNNLNLSPEEKVAPKLFINSNIKVVQGEVIVHNYGQNGIKNCLNRSDTFVANSSSGPEPRTDNKHDVVSVRDSGLGECDTTEPNIDTENTDKDAMNGTNTLVPKECDVGDAIKTTNSGIIQISLKTKDWVVIDSANNFSSSDITGICVLPDSSLLLCDYNNKCLRRMVERKIENSYKLKVNPFDVCAISDGELAISAPRQNKILTVSMRDLSILDSFRTDRPIKGIDSDLEYIFAASSTFTENKGGFIYVYTKDGATVQIIDLNKLSQFSLTPVRLCLDRNCLPLFTDSKHGLFRFESDGSLTHLYHDVDVCGVCVTSGVKNRDLIISCRTQSNRISVLNKNGKLLSTFDLPEVDWPVSVAFSKNTSTLTIGCLNSNMLSRITFQCNFNAARESLII